MLQSSPFNARRRNYWGEGWTLHHVINLFHRNEGLLATVGAMIGSFCQINRHSNEGTPACHATADTYQVEVIFVSLLPSVSSQFLPLE